MEQSKIDRINELAHLAKQRELTAGETSERAELRAEYIAEWRKNTQATLESTYVIGTDGVKRPLKRK